MAVAGDDEGGQTAFGSPDVQRAFARIWRKHKGLPREVADHRVMAAGLRFVLPRVLPLQLYRGERARLRNHGFSWTTDREMALTFATENGEVLGGRVL